LSIAGRIFLFLIILLCSGLKLSAQLKLVVRGSVTDSTRQAIPGANIRMIAGKDTLSTNTDKDGKFSFDQFQSPDFSLLIRSIGYRPASSTHSFKSGENTLQLKPILLRPDTQMLKEVVIEGKIVAMKVKKDTLEYNTAAYKVRDGDHVDQLLKQLPGVEVDEKGKVTSMGKEMTKIRVNGKDFFTGNVKEFIKQLPAEMFSHIQVVDDYGDEARLTGIKMGEPKKVLNLVTKPGRNRGTFGNAGVEGGTNNRYGFQTSGNVWKDDKQIGLNANLNNTNNSAGSTQGLYTSGNYRNHLSKRTVGSANYAFNHNLNENKQFNYIERVNPLGTLYTTNDNASESKSNGHNFDLNLQGNYDKEYLTASLNGSFSNGRTNSSSENIQKGAIRQDLYNSSNSNQHNPSLNGNFGWGKSFAKKGRTVYVNLSGVLGSSKSDQDMMNKIGYYDQKTGAFIKDSLLNRLVDNKSSNDQLTASFSFSEPLNRADDTVSTKSIDFNYVFSLSSTNNSLQTRVRDPNGVVSFVDSLSNVYHSAFLNNNFRVSYRYGSKRLNYTAGISLQPSSLKGSYEGRTDRIRQNTLNFSPSGNLNFVISPSQALSGNYNGSSNAPDFQQLQPVADTRDLQNVIIGNPNLKTSFNHNANVDYRLFDPAGGLSFQIGLNTSLIQNQVVANVVLAGDSLNSLKQETRYVNANGNYNIGTSYTLSYPFSKRRFAFTLNGNLDRANDVLFTDGKKSFSKRFNYNQQLSFSANTDKLSMTAQASYGLNANTYSLSSAGQTRNVETWTFNVYSRLILSKSWTLNFNSSKRINSGYSIAANNPLLINAGIEKTIFKKRTGMLTFAVNDLLNQGNGLNRTFSDNAVTESRTDGVTRFFLLGFSMRLQDFGLH
jgi:hypothetical protein